MLHRVTAFSTNMSLQHHQCLTLCGKNHAQLINRLDVLVHVSQKSDSPPFTVPSFINSRLNIASINWCVLLPKAKAILPICCLWLLSSANQLKSFSSALCQPLKLNLIHNICFASTSTFFSHWNAVLEWQHIWNCCMWTSMLRGFSALRQSLDKPNNSEIYWSSNERSLHARGSFKRYLWIDPAKCSYLSKAWASYAECDSIEFVRFTS